MYICIYYYMTLYIYIYIYVEYNHAHHGPSSGPSSSPLGPSAGVPATRRSRHLHGRPASSFRPGCLVGSPAPPPGALCGWPCPSRANRNTIRYGRTALGRPRDPGACGGPARTVSSTAAAFRRAEGEAARTVRATAAAMGLGAVRGRWGRRGEEGGDRLGCGHIEVLDEAPTYTKAATKAY